MQTKCVRYYMNFERALALMRDILAREGRAFDADNKEGEPGRMVSFHFEIWAGSFLFFSLLVFIFALGRDVC